MWGELDALIVDDVHTLRGHLAASSFEKRVALINVERRIKVTSLPCVMYGVLYVSLSEDKIVVWILPCFTLTARGHWLRLLYSRYGLKHVCKFLCGHVFNLRL